jgi:hypothetical protein
VGGQLSAIRFRDFSEGTKPPREEGRMQTTTRRKRYLALRIVALVLIGGLFVTVAAMNLTPGHFGFPDSDGCACFVAYTTHPSLPECEGTRPIFCDGLWIQQPLLYLSHLDLNK